MTESRNQKVVVFTGGGTGGHIFPALALAEEFQHRKIPVLYIGSKNGLEAKLVPKANVPFVSVHSGGIKNFGMLSKIKSFLLVGYGFFESLWILIQTKPKAVIGVGGYVSVPVVAAAVLLRIPIFIQEQNTCPGIANIFLSRFSKKTFLGFELAKKRLAGRNCLTTGNPLRKPFYEFTHRKLDTSKPAVLVIGGSQGAIAINTVMMALAPQLARQLSGIEIYHQTGPRDFNRVDAYYKDLNFAGIKATPFIDDILEQYQRASLVVARSGALTVSELIQLKKPALFVPFPRTGDNDQTTNAYYLERLGVAKVVEQGDGFTERFSKTFFELFRSETLAEMVHQYGNLPSNNAVKIICDEVLTSS